MRRTQSLIFIAGVSVVAAACGTATAAPNGIDTMTPAKAETSVTNAIKKATAVRMVISVTQHGVTSTQVLDAATVGGRRTLQVSGGTATILVTARYAYLKAPSAILSSNFGLTPTDAKKDSGQWLSFPSGTTPYFSLASGVGISALAQEVALTSVKRKTHPQINGENVTTLEGSSPSGTLDLFIPTSGPTLPIAGSITVAGSIVKFAFSRWGIPINLTPPAKSSPFVVSSPSTTVPASPTTVPASPTTTAPTATNAAG